MGSLQMGIFKSTCPFPYWNCHIERVNPDGKTLKFGDFFVNPRMVTNSILERVSDWTIPVWKQAISWNWFQNGFSKWYQFPSRFVNSHLVTPIWKRGAVCFESLFHMGIFCWQFPFGDPHMEMVSRMFWIPLWKRWLTVSIWGFAISHFLQMGKYWFLSQKNGDVLALHDLMDGQN